MDTVASLHYRIFDLPDPTLYWGGSKDSENANIKDPKLFATYPPEIPLNAEFRVESWKMVIKNDSLSGKGGNLSSAEDRLKEIQEKTLIEIEAVVIGPDGKRRVIKGTWKVIPWKDERDLNIVEPGG